MDLADSAIDVTEVLSRQSIDVPMPLTDSIMDPEMVKYSISTVSILLKALGVLLLLIGGAGYLEPKKNEMKSAAAKILLLR